MKKGDKIRFNGHQGEGTYNYHNTTVGSIYEITGVERNGSGGGMYLYVGDNGKTYVWRAYLEKLKNDFTLVPAQNAAPIERDPNTLQEGDIIKFMGVPEGTFRRYRDTTVGKEYEIIEVFTEYGKINVRYRDNAGDRVRWCPQDYEQMYFFKVMTEGRLYKDDVLATAPTVQDLQSILDLALLLNDIEWAQDLYQQIQQMEGEHA